MLQQPAPTFDPQHDLLSALTQWVEQGVAPSSVIATKYKNDQPPTVAMQRPICVFPKVAHYDGTGNPNNSNSFECVDFILLTTITKRRRRYMRRNHRKRSEERVCAEHFKLALQVRDAATLTETWWGHDIGFGIGIAHGFATLGTIGFEGRFDYAAIGTVSNVASRLCDEAKPGQILISPRVLMKVENAVTVEPVGEFALKVSGGLWQRTMWSPLHRPKCESGNTAAGRNGKTVTTSRASLSVIVSGA